MPRSSPQRQDTRRQQQRSASWVHTLRLLLRLLVTGVGVAVLTGTVLHRYRPATGNAVITTDGPAEQDAGAANHSSEARFVGWITTSLGAGARLHGLEERFQMLAAAQPDLLVGAYVAVLGDGQHASLNPDRATAAASAIKTPLLLLTLLARSQGELRWDETLQLQPHLVGGGSGWMGSEPPGSRFPLYMAAREMITVSDNTATNLLVERLGGMEAVNRRFLALRLQGTRVNNWLPDLDGTNTTTPRDLALTLAMAENSALLSQQDRDRFRAIHGSSRPDSLLPLGFLQGLAGAGVAANVDQALIDRGVRILNKTGDIGTAYADAGTIELPDGRRAVAAFLVEGTETTPYNSPRMRRLIQNMAAATAKVLRDAPPSEALAQSTTTP